MFRITLDQLRAFERIAELGTFNAAARDLGLAQPSISQRIRELEASIGAPIFTRRGPKISLTIEGRTLLDYARRMLGVETEIAKRFESRDPLRGMLRFGATNTFGLVCLVDLLRQLELRYPQLKISLMVETSNIINGMLNEQELDIAIVSEPDLEPHVEQVPVGRNNLVWLASTRLGLPLGEISPHRLAAEHLMVIPPPSRVHRTIMDWFAQVGAEPIRLSYCNNLSVLLVAISEALAVGVAPARVVHRELAQGLIRRLDTRPPLPSHRVFICYQSVGIGPGIKAVVALARQLIAEKGLYVPA
jgi:DNA-binding transcriptional LysR family regulator